jgi:hypothetical protein
MSWGKGVESFYEKVIKGGVEEDTAEEDIKMDREDFSPYLKDFEAGDQRK